MSYSKYHSRRSTDSSVNASFLFLLLKELQQRFTVTQVFLQDTLQQKLQLLEDHLEEQQHQIPLQKHPSVDCLQSVLWKPTKNYERCSFAALHTFMMIYRSKSDMHLPTTQDIHNTDCFQFFWTFGDSNESTGHCNRKLTITLEIGKYISRE